MRGIVKYKRVVYSKGDLMPPTFTERDKNRVVYSRRLEAIEVADEPLVLDVSGEDPVATQPQPEKLVQVEEKPEVVKPITSTVRPMPSNLRQAPQKVTKAWTPPKR